MSSLLKRIFILFGILCVLQIQDATAITCYECNSEYDPRCGDPFDNYTLGTINCDAKTGLDHLPHLNATLCRKTTQKVYGKVRVVRGCGYVTDVRDNGDCMKRLGTHDVQALYCSCTSELCNGGITRKPFGMLMIDSKNLFINSLPLIFITIFIISNCNQIVNNL